MIDSYCSSDHSWLTLLQIREILALLVLGNISYLALSIISKHLPSSREELLMILGLYSLRHEAFIQINLSDSLVLVFSIGDISVLYRDVIMVSFTLLKSSGIALWILLREIDREIVKSFIVLTLLHVVRVLLSHWVVIQK